MLDSSGTELRGTYRNRRRKHVFLCTKSQKLNFKQHGQLSAFNCFQTDFVTTLFPLLNNLYIFNYIGIPLPSSNKW